MTSQKSDIYKFVGKRLLELEVTIEPIRVIVKDECIDLEFAGRLSKKIRRAIDSFLIHRLVEYKLDKGLITVNVAEPPKTRIIRPADEEHNLMEQDTVDPDLPWLDEI